MNQDAELALALSQLRGLLKAGFDVSTATERIAKRLSEGPLKESFTRAAWSIAGGHEPGLALSEAVPPSVAGILTAGEGASLESRLDLLADYARRQHTLNQSLRRVLWYPTMIAVGALSLLGVLLLIRASLDREIQSGSLTPLSLFIGSALIGLLLWSSYTARNGQIPYWITLLPGGDVGRLTTLARTFSLAACYADERAGKGSLATALRNAVQAERVGLGVAEKSRLEDLDVAGLLSIAVRPPWSGLVLLGAAAGKPALGLRRAVARLERQVERQRKLFALSSGVLLLILAAAVVLWTWWYFPFGTMTAGLL